MTPAAALYRMVPKETSGVAHTFEKMWTGIDDVRKTWAVSSANLGKKGEC